MSLIPLSIRVILVGLLAFLAAGDSVPPANAQSQIDHPAVIVLAVNITNPLGRFLSLGTGTVVSRGRSIVTNYHVLYDTKSGQPYDAVLVLARMPSHFAIHCIARPKDARTHPKKDLASFHCSSTRPDKIVPIAGVPSPGLPITVKGLWPASLAIRSQSGTILGPTEDGFHRMDIPIWQGASGGPVIDNLGRLVGIVTGYRVLHIDGKPASRVGIFVSATDITKLF